MEWDMEKKAPATPNIQMANGMAYKIYSQPYRPPLSLTNVTTLSEVMSNAVTKYATP